MNTYVSQLRVQSKEGNDNKKYGPTDCVCNKKRVCIMQFIRKTSRFISSFMFKPQRFKSQRDVGPTKI